MLKKLILLLIISFCTVSCTSPKNYKLQSLLENKEFFRLRNALKNNSDKIERQDLLYYKSYVDNAFNRNDNSNKNIDSLLNEFGNTISDSLKAELLQIQMDNYGKTYEYAKAAKVSEILLNTLTHAMDSVIIDDIKTTSIIWNGLASTPKQESVFTRDEELEWKRDKARLMNVHATINNISMDFIFDTGANFSTINRSVAEKLGLKIIEVSFDVGGSTGGKVKSALCVTDLKLGNILVKNVVFLVLPEEQLSFPQIDYYVNGIVGYPVIEQLKEVRINKNGKITIPIKPAKSNLNNLALDGLMPIVFFRTATDTLCFHFDTGANRTDLFKPYLDKYHDEVVKNGELKTVTRGGAGAIVETEVYVLKDFKLFIGDREAVIPKVSVITKDIDERGDKFYGNLGQDLISLFDEMIINFDYMYIDFE